MADNDYKESLSLDVGKFLGGLKQAQDSLKTFGQQGKAQIEMLANQFDTMKASIVESVKAFAVLAAAPTALLAMVKSAGEAAEELDEIRIKTGLSTQASQEWDVALRRAGLTSNDLATMFGILSQKILEARNGTSQAAKMFDLLGISQKTLATGNASLILKEMAQRFSGIQDGATKASLAMELLGRGGLQFLPAMEGDLNEAAAAAERFGKLTEDQIAQLASMDDAFDDLGTAIEKSAQVFSAQFAPSVKAVVESLTDLVVMLKDIASGTIGSLLTKVVQGWSALFVGFVQLLKEVGVNLNAVGQSIKALFTESSLNLGNRLQQIWSDVSKQIDAIEAETEQKMSGIFFPQGAEAQGNKQALQLPEDPKAAHDAAVKALDGEYKKQQAIIEAQKQAALDQAAFEKVQIQEKVALREAGSIKVTEVEAKTNADILRAKVAANNQLVQADYAYYQKRVALARQSGGSKDEESAATQEFQTLQINRSKDMASLQAEIKRQGLQDTIKIMQAEEAAESAHGQRLEQGIQSNYKISRDMKLRELADTVALKDADVAAGEADLASYEDMARRRLASLQAHMDQELAAQEGNAQQQQAIRTRYNAQIDQQQRRLQNGFVEGWREAFNSYVNDMTGPLGMGVDMMRQTAMQMQQAFQTIFFNAFSNQIHGLKDLLTDFSNFLKQIISQVLSIIATRAVLQGLGGAFGNFLPANAGGEVQRFALGGPVMGFGNRDTVPALLTPGEYVLSRQDVSDIKSGAAGGVNVIVNNYGQNDVKATSGQGPDGKRAIYITVRDMVRGMVQGGDMDSAMNRRFGITPGSR